MEDNYIIGLVIIFILSFLVFKKDKSAPVTANSARKDVKSYRDSSGATGVAKYLKNQEGDVASASVSGVAKYLQEKEAQNAEKEENSAVSGVAKYLASKEETPVSGVSKYMARQAVHAKKMAKENVSGVEKYLNNRG